MESRRLSRELKDTTLTLVRGRNNRQTAQARADLREFVGYSRADELEKLEKLKASGAISADEFAKLRAQVIG